MSHSTFLTDDDGREWVLIHNGDWSGDVEMRRIERGETASGGPEKDRIVETHTVPGALIRQACAASVVSGVIGMLEQWDGSRDAAFRAEQALRLAPKSPKRSR
jgi:hypothetical protein